MSHPLEDGLSGKCTSSYDVLERKHTIMCYYVEMTKNVK